MALTDEELDKTLEQIRIGRNMSHEDQLKELRLMGVSEQQYREEIDISQKDFYKLISESKTTVSTSQPSPAELTDFWRKILREYDELVYIPMSSGLSSSCTTAAMTAKDFGGRVHVVNNQRISVTQYQSVIDALAMAKSGMSGKRIKVRPVPMR